MGSTQVQAAADPAAALRAAEGRLFAAHRLTVRERFLELERPSMRMRVLEAGEGPPVLHLHGGGGFGALHAPLAAAMPGRRHLMIDRPGFGVSDRVALGPDFRADSIELLTSTLRALGLETVDVIANSIGSAMALWFALARPSSVRSLGLAGGAAMIGETEPPLVLRLLGTPVIGPLLLRLEPPSERQVRTLWKRFGHPTGLHPTVLDVTLAAERVPSYAVAWRELLKATLSFQGTKPGLELKNEELRGLKCPVAFAWGANDPMVDVTVGRSVAALLPGARFTLTGTGHLPWLNDAVAVARALEPVLTPT